MDEDKKTHWNLDATVVGSHVLVDGGRYGVSRIHTVTTANARKVTLSDKSEWTRRGRQWGTATDRWMTGPHARLILNLPAVRADVAAEHRRANLLGAQRKIGNRFDHEAKHLSLDEIVAVSAILDANKAAREPKAEGPDEVGEQGLRPSADGAHHD